MDINRRTFIFGTAAAAALAGRAAGSTGARALKPGEKRTVALIGCGLQMQHLAKEFMKAGALVTTVCDCDRTRAAAMAKMVGKTQGAACKITPEFRDVLADPNVDMVCVATPDHWHAYICVEAMKSGKDVYCEKPLTYSVQETKEVIAAARKYGRVFQTGSMQRSSREFFTAVSLVRGGLIGNVRFVDANFGNDNTLRGGPSQPSRFWDDPKNAAKESAPNPDVDWIRWLGPAALRPYSDQLAPRGVHRFFPNFWRCDDDLASGYCGDWGAHHFDIAQWGLDMDRSGPVKAICSDEPHSTNLLQGGRRQFGMRMIFKKDYGEVEMRHGPFRLGWGTVFYGDDGIVAVNRGRIAVWTGTGLVKPEPGIRANIRDCKFMPEKIAAKGFGKSLNAALDTLQKRFGDVIARAGLYRSENHVKNFCECVESRKATITDAETGGRACTLCHIANMSYKFDTGFDWDPVNMEFANGTGKGIPLARVGDCNGWTVKA